MRGCCRRASPRGSDDLRELCRSGNGVRAQSLRLAMSMTHSPLLLETKQRWLDRSMADGRRGVTQQGVRWWLFYTVMCLGVSPLPDPFDRSMQAAAYWELKLEDYAIWVAYCRPSGRQCSYETVLKYCSETRGWVLKSTMPAIRLGLGAEVSRISALMRGYAREVPQPPKMERVGVTPSELASGMEAGGCGANWRAALTFGLLALARGVEFSLGDNEEFDEEEHMVPADACFSWVESTRVAKVKMRKRKDLKLLKGKHAEVVLVGSGGGGFVDAVAELEQWLAERRRLGIPEGRPLFCHTAKPWRGFTVSEVRDEVKRLMGLVGRDPRLYGAHSLRIGGATAALAAGVSPQMIRLMGRWSSDVYELYCRMSLQSAVGIGRAISSAMVTGVHEQFHDEHLEVLPSEVRDFEKLLPEGDHVDDTLL